MKITTPGLALSSLLIVLSGCSDDSGTEDAIREQNRILKEQQSQRPGQDKPAVSSSVTVTGRIENIVTGESITQANVRVQAFGQWSEVKPLNGGELRFEGLPASSDYAIEITSLDDSFMQQTHFLTTVANTSTQVVFEDLGILPVAPAYTHQIRVVNENNQPVEDVVFRARSSASNRYIEYTSTVEGGVHQLTLPNGLYSSLYIDTDANDDGAREYLLSNYYDLVDITPTPFGYLLEGHIRNIQWLVVQQVDQKKHEADLNLSILGKDGLQLANASPVILDPLAGDIQGIYSAETEQYTFTNISLDSRSVNIMIPAFTIGEDHYSSARVSVGYSASLDSLFIEQTRQNGYGYDEYRIAGTPREVDLVISPRLTAPSSPLRVVSKSNTEQLSSASAKPRFFFSSPIGLLANGTALSRTDNITITKGNSSANDAVIPGNTLIENAPQDVPFKNKLSLNDTLLTIESVNSLQSGSYRVDVNAVYDVNADLDVDIDEDVQFFVYNGSAFDIKKDVVADNNNFLKDQSLITARNTAGVAPSYYYAQKGGNLYFPESIRALKNLRLDFLYIVEEGVSKQRSRTYEIVRNGRVEVSLVYAVATAMNEQIIASVSVDRGTTLPNGKYYKLSTYGNVNDDIDSQENSMTFRYHVEDYDGNIDTGTITLPMN